MNKRYLEDKTKRISIYYYNVQFKKIYFENKWKKVISEKKHSKKY